MSDYAVINPATGETPRSTRPSPTRSSKPPLLSPRRHTSSGRGPRPSRSAPRWCDASASCTPSGARSWPRSRCAKWASRWIRRSARSTSASTIYELLRRQRGRALEGRADHAARRRGHRRSSGAAPSACCSGIMPWNFPYLPGRPLCRPQPGDRQHGAAEARAPVPRDRRGAAEDLPRRRLPRGRLRQHLRDQRPDRDRHRRPARAGRFADRLGARRRRGRRDRRPAT